MDAPFCAHASNDSSIAISNSDPLNPFSSSLISATVDIKDTDVPNFSCICSNCSQVTAVHLSDASLLIDCCCTCSVSICIAGKPISAALWHAAKAIFLEVASNPSILSSDPSAGATLIFGTTTPPPIIWSSPILTGCFVCPNTISSASSFSIFVKRFTTIYITIF